MWCKDKWDKSKNVTRGIIFRQATHLLPSHCKGDINSTQFQRMKHWFYGGFKKRMCLSKRRISSTGQKLPKYWEQKGLEIIARVAEVMMPMQRPDGGYRPGAKDDDVGNFDHCPFYIEDHSNGYWGLKESIKRRCITTGGKDKSRFTAQLTIFKSGQKICHTCVCL